MRTLIFIYFVFLYSCDSPVKPQTKDIATPPDSFSGKVFKSKAFLFFDLDSQYIEVNRLSSSPPETLQDTIRIEGIHSGNTILYMTLPRSGEQLEFTKDSVKIWLKEFAIAEIYLASGKLNKLKIFGDGYIETPHSILVTTNNNIEMNLKSHSILNLSNDVVTGLTTISLIKGELQVSAEFKEDSIMPISLLTGKEIVVAGQTGFYKIRNCDLSNVADWKFAGLLRFSDATLSTIMTSIDKWYKTYTVYRPESLYNSEHKYYITFPYTTPLDTALARLRFIDSLNLDRRGDTIIVSRKK